MKKVFLYVYDRVNLGDDLFIYTITKRYPDVQFYLWTDKENIKTFQSLKNLKVIDQESKYFNILKTIRPSLMARFKYELEKKCDAVVYIGGSLFIEYDNWENILNWWEYEAENRPFYVLGANFGPYKSEAYRTKLGSIFSKMKDVCFRDSYSYQKFEGNNVVRSASDILFSCELPKVDVVKKQIFISVIDLLSKDEGSNKLSIYDNLYVDKLLQIVNGYLNQGYSIVLSSFCKYEGDENTIKRIMEECNLSLRNTIQILNYDGTNMDEILLSIEESEAIIASRFHAVILGIVAGKPVYPIVYSDKTIHVLDDIEFKGEYADVRKLVDLDFEQIERSLSLQQKYPIEELKESALKHFEKLDELLK